MPTEIPLGDSVTFAIARANFEHLRGLEARAVGCVAVRANQMWSMCLGRVARMQLRLGRL